MKIVNLTTHDVVLSNGMATVTFPPSGNVARVEPKVERGSIQYDVADGVQLRLPTVYSTEAKISNLPKPKPGVYYIVSNYVAQTARRKDLLAPNTDGTAERDNGNVVSVKGFQQYLDIEYKED